MPYYTATMLVCDNASVAARGERDLRLNVVGPLK